MGRKRILGKITDFITGREITDTDDERLRQGIARMLVNEKGYSKDDIETRKRFPMDIEGQKVFSLIDFIIRINGRSFLAIKYGPGSLVTRERPALAVARILEPYQVPLAVVTNGIDAELLDTATGTVIATGLDSIPDRESLLKQFQNTRLKKLPAKQVDAERRILSAYDFMEHSLECDDDWCKPE